MHQKVTWFACGAQQVRMPRLHFRDVHCNAWIAQTEAVPALDVRRSGCISVQMGGSAATAPV